MNKTQQLLKEELNGENNILTGEQAMLMERDRQLKKKWSIELLNSLKEEISKLPVDLVNTKFNKDDKDEFVDAIRVSDIDALLSETISTLTNSNEKM